MNAGLRPPFCMGEMYGPSLISQNRFHVQTINPRITLWLDFGLLLSEHWDEKCLDPIITRENMSTKDNQKSILRLTVFGIKVIPSRSTARFWIFCCAKIEVLHLTDQQVTIYLHSSQYFSHNLQASIFDLHLCFLWNEIKWGFFPCNRWSVSLWTKVDFRVSDSLSLRNQNNWKKKQPENQSWIELSWTKIQAERFYACGFCDVFQRWKERKQFFHSAQRSQQTTTLKCCINHFFRTNTMLEIMRRLTWNSPNFLARKMLIGMKKTMIPAAVTEATPMYCQTINIETTMVTGRDTRSIDT